MIELNQTLNNTYQITEKLGSGGGGVVYKAYHTRLQKYVAVKLIKDNVKGVINKRAEADILKKLKHEGLPQVYDFIEDGEDIYTVMEFIDGCPLHDVIVKEGKISYKQTLIWAKELCSAAAYLHTRKPPIIHSDIKPANIMITGEGKVCLIDFNISSVFGNGIYTVGSSDGYSPPEQYTARADRAAAVGKAAVCDNGKTEIIGDETKISGDTTEIISEMQNAPDDPGEQHITDNTILDPRSDVYSIGAVMYSMLTGRKPNNSRRTVTPVRKFDDNIPEALVYIIERAMSREKEKRFSSAKEMLEALENLKRYDRSYRRLAVGQEVSLILCAGLFAGSVISAISGCRLMQAESADRLSGYISAMNEMSVSGDYSGFDNIFQAVEKEYPGTPEAFYYKALMLYSQGDHEAAQEFINENSAKALPGLSKEMQSGIYFISADILFRQEMFPESIEYYKIAVENNTGNPDIYRDYAIALARSGDTGNAENILQTAINAGLSEDGIFMVTGEIQFMRGEFSEAVISLKNGIEITDNDILKRNAYLLCSRAYREMYSSGDEMILENISLLENSLTSLPQDMTMQLREYLAQGYIDYGEVSGSGEYFAKAVNLLSEMKSLGWSNYRTEMNIAMLCSRLGSSETARRLLLDMAEIGGYEPYLFVIYTRLAYCEAEIQGKQENDLRDYSDFDKYYQSAKEAYADYSERNGSDPEMEKLEMLRSELVTLGWLEEE